MSRPRLLDLFCGAGGAAMGYHRAGFDVVGVDSQPQPNYPFEFIHADALEFLRLLRPSQRIDFDAIHASPPCQTFTAYRRKGHGVGDGYLNLIPETRDLLERTGLPYVIENVEQARAELRDPVTLCGSSFALDVRRHRLFETNWPLTAPACRHDEQESPGKRYPGATNRDGRFTCEVGVWRIPFYRQQVAMGGVHWMTLEELSEAVPPAYTESVGKQLMAQIGATAETSISQREPVPEIARSGLGVHVVGSDPGSGPDKLDRLYTEAKVLIRHYEAGDGAAACWSAHAIETVIRDKEIYDGGKHEFVTAVAE